MEYIKPIFKNTSDLAANGIQVDGVRGGVEIGPPPSKMDYDRFYFFILEKIWLTYLKETGTANKLHHC